MIVLAVVGVVCGVVFVVSSAAAWHYRPRRSSVRGLLAERLRARVIVTTKGGDVFAGVLYEADARVCVLRDAKLLGEGGSAVGADGEVILDRADVAYLQVP